MKRPKHEIPSRDDWRELRDGAGGTKNLVRKVSIGKRLDEFEKAYRKADSRKKLQDLSGVVEELQADVALYIKKVARSHKELAKVVEERLLRPAADFAERLESFDEEHDRAQEAATERLRSELEKITKTASEVRDEGQSLLEELVPDLPRIVEIEAGTLDDLPDVRNLHRDRLIKRHGRSEQLARDNLRILEQLEKELLDLVVEYRSEQPAAVDVLNNEKVDVKISISEVNDKYLKPGRRVVTAPDALNDRKIVVETTALGRPKAEIKVAKEIHETVINLLNIR